MARTFFRIVRTAPPTINDFISAEAKGRMIAPSIPYELHRLWDGLSVYATAQQAARKARRSPSIGRYVAELHIPEDGAIRFERTTREPGHHTLWGEPEVLLRCVMSVRPVAEIVSGAER